MKTYIFLFYIIIAMFSSCKNDDDSPRQKKYLDYIVIEAAKLEAWDISQ